jgi:uncharacterized protein YcgI (DUF1989 family)
MTSERTLVSEHVIPADKDGHGGAYELRAGQTIRIGGVQTVDFVAFNLHDLGEQFDQARTRTNQLKLFLTEGDVLFSKDNNAMLTITHDGWPYTHDLQKGLCSRKRHEMAFRGEARTDKWGGGNNMNWKTWEDIPQRGCWENLTTALEPWGVDRWHVPSGFNIFQNMHIDGETGQMWFDHHRPTEPAFIEMRAEMDLLVAGSHHFAPTPTTIEIYES